MMSEIYEDTQLRRLEDKYCAFMARTIKLISKVQSISAKLPKSILGQDEQEVLRQEIEYIIQESQDLQGISSLSKVDEIENIQLLEKFLTEQIKISKPFSLKVITKTIHDVFLEITGLVSDYAKKKDKERENLSEQWKSITKTIKIKHKQMVDTTNSILAENENEKQMLEDRITKLRNKVEKLSLNKSKETSYHKLSPLASSSHSQLHSTKKSKSRTPTPVFAGNNKRKRPRKVSEIKIDIKSLKNNISQAFDLHMKNSDALFEYIEQAVESKFQDLSRIQMRIYQKVHLLSYKFAAKDKINQSYKDKVKKLKHSQVVSEDLIFKLESELSTIKSESESNQYIKNESFATQSEKYGIGLDEKIEFLQSKIEELSFENRDLCDKIKELGRKNQELEEENTLMKEKEIVQAEKVKILEEESSSLYEISGKYKENERILLKVMSILGVEDKSTLMLRIHDLQPYNKHVDFFSCSSISFHSEDAPEDSEDKTGYLKNLKRQIEDLENELKVYRAQKTSFGEIMKTFVQKLPNLNQEQEQIARMMLKMLGFVDEEIVNSIIKT